MNTAHKNFLLDRKASHLKELSELKDTEIEILENLIALDKALSIYEDDPEPIPETELPFTTKFVSMDERTIEVSISEEQQGEDKDKFHGQILEIVKCLLDLIKPSSKESSFFMEQETKKCTEPFLKGLADTMFSVTYNTKDITQEDLKDVIEELSSVFGVPQITQPPIINYDPSTTSNTDNYIRDLAILEERKIQEKIREEENEKENKFLSILDRLTKAFEKYVKKIK
jgi:hypothetical protein